MSEYLSQLSSVQRDAATKVEGPSLIIAGAGSGKTRVLTYRIAHMLEVGIAPYNILALTFTNKAAKEMKERIATIVTPERARNIWMGTFHSIFARILRNESELLGYPSTFTIYDTADSKNVLKGIIKDLNLSDDYYKPGDLMSRISLAKNNLVTPDAYMQNATLVAEDREKRRPQFGEVYKMYAQRCRAYGAMDFDDLLLYMNILLRDFPQVLDKYQKLFKYIMVDEYQDTNMAQYMIIKKMSQAHGNICVVGDDAQSIYSFRGAKIENILRFQKDYPTAQVFKLEQNYRSTQTIVNAANSVITKNRKQLKKSVFSAGAEGEKIRVVRAYTDREEASVVSSDIYAQIRNSALPYSSFAILYRTNAQSRAFEESLRKLNIPYKIRGGMSFYQRKEIKDILAYIRLIINHRDDEALMRIINYPTRGIGDVTVAKIKEAAAQQQCSMWEMINRIDAGNGKGASAKILQFAAMIGELTTTVVVKDAYEAAMEIATKSGIIGSFKMQQTPESISVLENIEELMNSIKAFIEMSREENPEIELVTIDQWLENVALLTEIESDNDDDRNYVTLMTIHSAKGLEFEYVYIVGLEDNLFPSQMCLSSMDGIEEERRLFYVALTRAKVRVMLSLSQSRYQWGKPVNHPPSRFLKEIEPQYLEVTYEETACGNEDDDQPVRFGNKMGAGLESRTQYFKNEHHTRPQGSTPRRRVVEDVKPLDVTGDSRFKRVSGSALTASAAGSSEEIEVGMRVEHDKFGRGTVTEVEDSPNGMKYTVDFPSAGSKTLLAKYAKLRVLS